MSVTILDLIPKGKENAINRNILTEKCILNGLIDKNVKDPDRAMRNLLGDVRGSCLVCNVGSGYFIATKEDKEELSKDINASKSRIRKQAEDIRYKEKFLEDIEKGRLD